MISVEEENLIIAKKHLEVGNIMNAPQIEMYSTYPGIKYAVYDGNKGFICANDEGQKKRDIVSWTPVRSVAEQVVSNLKKAGWKYKDAAVVELTKELVKANKFKVNAHAGFYKHTIVRRDTVVEIVPESQVIIDYKEQLAAQTK